MAIDLRTTAARHEERNRALRHELHRYPELGLDLPRTQSRVLDELADLGLEITTGTDTTSIVAVLRGGARAEQDAPVVLLRADMDALAVDEHNDLPYRSQVPGVMHACGHDLHTAMLAGAARVLAEHRDALRGDVVFMFQPGEEMHDGAAVMIREGVLDAAGRRPDAAFGMHVFASGVPLGKFVSRSGPMLAAADGLRVNVVGRGGHASRPQDAVDPVPIACEMVLALQSFVTRRFDVFDPIVCTVGAIAAGDLAAPNAIQSIARFAASVRFWSPETRERFHGEVDRLLEGIAAAHGATVEVEHVTGYPATITDASETEFVAATVGEVFGEERFEFLPQPFAGSEDFSHVLAEIPGSFIGLGATPADLDPAAAAFNHSPEARYADEALVDGTTLYAEIAMRRLAQLAG